MVTDVKSAQFSILYSPSRLSLPQVVRYVGRNVGQRRHVRILCLTDDFLSIVAREIALKHQPARCVDNVIDVSLATPLFKKGGNREMALGADLLNASGD